MRSWNEIRACQNLVFIGIKSRGEVLAERLAAKIKSIEGTEIPHGALDITFYRDDAGTHKPEKAPTPTQLPFDVNNKKVILVDDVLYTGRSARAAIDQIIDFGRPSRHPIWRSWWTGATGNSPSTPITSAKTSPPAPRKRCWCT